MIKTFEIDIENEDDLKRHLNILKSHLGNLKPMASKRETQQRMFESCLEILDIDIESVYDLMDLSEEKKFYVYLHCYPDRPIQISKKHYTTSALATLGASKIPFYVGKGCGSRAFDLDRNGLHRKIRQTIKMSGKEVEVTILKEGLTEKQALCLESKIIDIMGLQGKGGALCNLDEGARAAERRELYLESYRSIRKYNQMVVAR